MITISSGIRLGAILAMACAPVSGQNVSSGMASAFSVDARLSALGLLDVTVGPLPSASVTSPAPDSDQATLLTLNESLGLGSIAAQSATDDALIVNASSDITGLGASGNANASAVVNGLSLTIVPGILLIPDLVSITSTTLSSTSSSSGSFGSLLSTGSSVFEDLEVTVAGISIAIPVNPTPNFALDLSAAGIAGLSIILNEQILAGDGTGSSSITTNAIHVQLSAVDAGLGSALNGEIIIGSSSSSIAAVPEPSCVVLLGLGSLLIFRRRRDVPSSS